MEKLLLIEYPKCSTCVKAKKWLIENGIDFIDRHILEETPTAAELAEWKKRGKLPMKKLFNTSGISYRTNHLSEKLPGMTEEEQLKMLAGDGMLIKRPILVGEDFVLVGFKPAEWERVKG